MKRFVLVLSLGLASSLAAAQSEWPSRPVRFIVSQSTGGSIDVTSHNPFYGVIYAPDSQVDIGGTADFFGAIVGQTLRVHGDATGHYDESLELEEIDPPTRTTIVD